MRTETCSVISTTKYELASDFKHSQELRIYKDGVYRCFAIRSFTWPNIQTRPRRFIVNTDPADKPGTHWVVIFITPDGKGEFWDPFAQRSTGILQSELYSVFEQTLQHIHVEQKSFASRIIRRVWTICIILCATSMYSLDLGPLLGR